MYVNDKTVLLSSTHYLLIILILISVIDSLVKKAINNAIKITPHAESLEKLFAKNI
jgi:hypothetical protein